MGGIIKKPKQKGVESIKRELNLHCISQHFMTFYDQAREERVADFGEPCANCINVSSCDMDWFSKVKPIIDKTNLKLSYVKIKT